MLSMLDLLWCFRNVDLAFSVKIVKKSRRLCCGRSQKFIKMFKCNICLCVLHNVVFLSVRGAFVKSMQWTRRTPCNVCGPRRSQCERASTGRSLGVWSYVSSLGDLAPTFTGHLPAWSICHAPRRLRVRPPVSTAAPARWPLDWVPVGGRVGTHRLLARPRGGCNSLACRAGY